MTTTHFENRLTIDADPADVWALTENIERWPSITPTVTSVERIGTGPLTAGDTAVVHQPRQRPATWTVTEIEAPHRFVWTRSLLGVTMIAGHHLTDTDDGCEQTLTIDLDGRGARLLARLVGRAIATAIATENASFKRHAEASGHPAR